MKKLLSLLLVTLLCLIPQVALAQSADASETPLTLEGVLSVPSAAPDDIGVQAGSILTVGNPTRLSGNFATDFFGSNTADMDIRRLLHGYSTVDWVKGVGMVVDGNVVSTMESRDDAAGRVYTFNLKSGLLYNDGTPITAKDYVFSILLAGLPQLREIGGSARGVDLLLGYSAYAGGQERAFRGVRLLNDTSFSVTIDQAHLPYFYGLAVVASTPYPYSVIVPGSDIRDDGDGAYIDGDFSAAVLQTTLLNPATGYVFNPKVTSGPYQLSSYDAANAEVRLTVNARYLGNYEGQKPHIETLVYKTVAQTDMVAQLAAGEIGLINKLTGADAATKAQELVGRSAAQMASYERSGLAYLAFDCGAAPTNSLAVRAAIARCVDKNALAEQAVGGGRGVVVNGYYGLGQWMVREQVGTEDAPMTAYESLESLAIPLDLDNAAALLVGDGWLLADGLRQKDGQTLTVRWAKTENNPIADAIETQLKSAFEQLGIELSVTEMPFTEVMAAYTGDNPAGYNMFFLASNFTMLFDPYYEFASGELNATRIDDAQLAQLALAMRNTDPQDAAGYVQKWMAFQQRFAQALPMAPLYSNAYLDVYSNNLQGYQIGEHITCADALLYAWIQQPAA